MLRKVATQIAHFASAETIAAIAAAQWESSKPQGRISAFTIWIAQGHAKTLARGKRHNTFALWRLRTRTLLTSRSVRTKSPVTR